jgi:hypothetical protein
MSRNNKQHRADKKRRADRRAANGGGRPSGPRPSERSEGGWQVELLAVAGAKAAAGGDDEVLQASCAAISRCSESMGRPTVTTSLGLAFDSVLASVWDGGWQPHEIVRQIRRARRGRHVEIVTAAMEAPQSWDHASGPMPDAWAEQLHDLGVAWTPGPARDWIGDWIDTALLPFSDALAVILETLGVLIFLPVIEPLIARPRHWGDVMSAHGGLAPDDPVLAKIRALLAKAESTGFEAESEALTAKAQELMTRHAIDDALARSERSSEERPVARRLGVDDPYSTAKSQLLRFIANANGVRGVWYPNFAMMALVGFEADVTAVEVLFTSLLVQASRAMLAKGSISDGRGRSQTRSFRQSFLLAFAGRIRERLAFAAMSVREEAERELDRSLLPVLAGRDREIDEALTKMFPKTVKSAGPVASNEAGWQAGRTAAELATLGRESASLRGAAAVS